MTWRQLHLLMICSLGFFSLVVLYLGRKPLCIDSRVIERIDRVISTRTETVWRCSLDRDVDFSPFLARQLPWLETRIARVEENLGRIEAFRKPLRIVVLPQRPWVFQLKEGVLFIGEQMLLSEGHLERGLVKAWLREKDIEIQSHLLAEEAEADLLQKIVSNALSLEDSSRGVRARFKARWPQVMKDSQAYCSSPWKLSEHYEACEKNPALLGDAAWRLSLRPLVSSALISAWKDQSLKNRLNAISSFAGWIRSVRGNEISHRAHESGPMASAQAVRDLIRLVSRRSSTSGDNTWMLLAASFTERLRRAGFNEALPEVNLDILVLSEDEIPDVDGLVKNLTTAATGDKHLKIAIKDPKNLWILPTQNRLPLQGLGGLKAERIAILHCGKFDFDFDWVLSFEPLAQRLFVIDACGGKNLPDLKPWVRGGAEAFAAANQNVRFIQFHLPSLALRKGELVGQSAVLPIIQNRNLNDPAFQTLGWQELNWSEQANAYHPTAHIEAIEWFRL